MAAGCLLRIESEIVTWKLCLGKSQKFSQGSTMIKKNDELEMTFNQVFGIMM